MIRAASKTFGPFLSISVLSFALAFSALAASAGTSGGATDLGAWRIELHVRSHGTLETESWSGSSAADGAGPIVELELPNGRRLNVPVSSAEAEALSVRLAPLSRKEKNFLELGICAQYLRLRTAFGSRKFCARQFTREAELADLLARLDGYRALALRAR